MSGSSLENETGKRMTEDLEAAEAQGARGGDEAVCGDGVKDLEAELARITAERDNLKLLYARLGTDFDNYRRRTQREMESMVSTAAEGVIVKVLPVVDNLERALAAVGPEPDAVCAGLAAGVDMTLKQLLGVLTQAGVEPISCVGEPFDPTRHEAIMQVQDDAVPDQTVVAELQRGYVLNGKVIRPSMVSVARPS